MKSKEIKINFIYESKLFGEFTWKQNEKLGDILLAFTSKNDINIKSVFFLLNGRKIEKSDYDKYINQIPIELNEKSLNILVYNYSNSDENNLLKKNKNITIFFSFKSNFIKIQSTMKTQILDICKSFANKTEKNLDSLNFYYRNKKLNLYRNLEEIVYESDKIRSQIDIYVEDKEIKVNSFCRKYKLNVLISILIISIIIVVILVFKVIIPKIK